MSAESLAPPIFVYNHDGMRFVSWCNCNEYEKDYYLRLMNNETTPQDDLEDLHLIQLRRFETWQRESDLEGDEE